MTTQHPIDRAAKAVEGGIGEIRKRLAVSPQTIANWRARGVPALYCARIEELSGGTVTRQELRPHDWRFLWPELADASVAKRAKKAG